MRFGTSIAGFVLVAIFLHSSQAQHVFFDDFDGGQFVATNVAATFSGVVEVVSVQGYSGIGSGGNTFGGQFLINDSGGTISSPGSIPPEATVLTLSGLPEHDYVDVSFLAAIIDTWDGDGVDTPDIFNVAIDGSVIFSETILNAVSSFPNGTQTYVPSNGAELANNIQLGFRNTGTDDFDDAYDMSAESAFSGIPHSSSDLTIEWFSSGAGWQGGASGPAVDESWAVENISVTVRRAPCHDGRCTIDPRTTYLRTHDDPNPGFTPPSDFVFLDADQVVRHRDSDPIELASLIEGEPIQEGDLIRLDRFGEFYYTNPTSPDTLSEVWAAFSASDRLLADEDAGVQNRIQDLIPVDLSDGLVRDLFTVDDGPFPSDIIGDFYIDTNDGNAGTNDFTVVRVPVGATHLFLSSGDTQWFDNLVPDGGEYGIQITKLNPFDFDWDTQLTSADADALLAAICSGSSNMLFDVNGDGSVDASDLTAFIEGVVGTIMGDANLDGTVDGQDFIAWNSGKFTSGAGWAGGDFNGDCVTDGQDFIIWNSKKFTSANGVVAVPEPPATVFVAMIVAAMCLVVCRR